MKKLTHLFELTTEVILASVFLTIIGVTFLLGNSLTPNALDNLNYDFKVLGENTSIKELKFTPLIAENSHYTLSTAKNTKDTLSQNLQIFPNSTMQSYPFVEITNKTDRQQKYSILISTKTPIIFKLNSEDKVLDTNLEYTFNISSNTSTVLKIELVDFIIYPQILNIKVSKQAFTIGSTR